jgi:large subunit ribosomal protein L15
MPPRLPALTAYCRAAPVRSAPLTAFLLPFLQARNASILGALSDTPGAYNKRIRRGRGPSSGKGKTSGRGHKGQKQHGKVPARFQGGQTPQEIVHGERGFENRYVPGTEAVCKHSPIDAVSLWRCLQSIWIGYSRG